MQVPCSTNTQPIPKPECSASLGRVARAYIQDKDGNRHIVIDNTTENKEQVGEIVVGVKNGQPYKYRVPHNNKPLRLGSYKYKAR